MTTKQINCGNLLDDCYKMIQEARMKAGAPYREISIHLVLPIDEAHALRYYFANNPGKLMSATGGINPYSTHLFGAIVMTSEVIETAIVF